MNIIGKIFVFAVFVMSLVFMSFAVAVYSTHTNWQAEIQRTADQVQAGRDYARWALALTAAGIFAHPYNQIIQEYAEMDELRAAWDEALGVAEPGKVQMILRVGLADAPYLSWRRGVDDVLL
jgi:hypothetical protein